MSLHYSQRFPGQTYDAETGLHYNFHRDYNPQTGRYVQSDPIGLGGGMNSFAYVGGSPINTSDLLGLLVSAVLDKNKRVLSVSDITYPSKKVVVTAFSGGHVTPTGQIVSPGTGLEIPAPAGSYFITDNPNYRADHPDWFGLLKSDGRVDDYFYDNGVQRSGVRLHGGTLSYGCVTVSTYKQAGVNAWNSVFNLVRYTSTSSIDFITGPYVWNPKAKITHYGYLSIK